MTAGSQAPERALSLAGIDLRPDCDRCAALCCMALFFDKSDQFALEKPAGVPCPNLDATCACTIYEARAENGFGGCIAYDCHGAGQRVTQAFFGGRTWADDPALLAPMTIAFGTLGTAHRLLLLLAQAETLALSAEDRATLQRLAGQIADAGDAAEQIGAIGAEITVFLKGLQRYLSPAERQSP